MIYCTPSGLFLPNETWSVTAELHVSPAAPSPLLMWTEVVVDDGGFH